MARIIRRPKKVCTINRSGKKKCFTIQARRRLNPDDEWMSSRSNIWVANTIVDALSNFKKYAEVIQKYGDFLSDSDAKILERLIPELHSMGGELLRIKLKLEK